MQSIGSWVKKVKGLRKKKKNIDNSMVIARGAGEGGINGDGKRLGFG